jgi:hypothetical protein
VGVTEQFTTDRNEPSSIRRFVKGWLTGQTKPPFSLEQIVAIRTWLVAPHTPDGSVHVYGLKLTDGNLAFFFWIHHRGVAFNDKGAAELFPGIATTRDCPHGWALQPMWGVEGYLFGRASARVASIHVLYRDGSTTQGMVKNGFFLAWMKSSAAATNVKVIAKARSGKKVASLTTAGSGQPPHDGNVWGGSPSDLNVCFEP